MDKKDIERNMEDVKRNSQKFFIYDGSEQSSGRC